MLATSLNGLGSSTLRDDQHRVRDHLVGRPRGFALCHRTERSSFVRVFGVLSLSEERSMVASRDDTGTVSEVAGSD